MRKKGDMMCSCGKRKGACDCKGYAYGSKKIQGYYMGDTAVATPQQEQEMMAMAPGARIQATGPTADFGQPSEAAQLAGEAAGQAVKGEITEAATEKLLGEATEEGIKAAAKGSLSGATKAATGAALGSFGGDVVGDLVTKGKVDEGTLAKAAGKAALTAALGPVGFGIGALVDMFKDGTPSVPPMGLADGSRYAMEAAEKSKMSPEEFQKKFLEERIVAPAEAFLEERPMMQAPLLLASAARDYERGELPLGKFGGGRLEGGKDRIAYRHKKYGDFEFNPESERVSYKKTFRF